MLHRRLVEKEPALQGGRGMTASDDLCSAVVFIRSGRKYGFPVQALCTEASLHALRRHYPQIYDSDEKLLIDPASVCVTRRDFLSAFSAMTPASHRSAAAHARCGVACSGILVARRAPCAPAWLMLWAVSGRQSVSVAWVAILCPIWRTSGGISERILLEPVDI
jgi:hypothetical protein